MKPIGKIVGTVIIFFLMIIADLPNLSEKWVPEAQAFRGRGAAFVVGAAVGSSASSSSAEASAAASQQQAATAQQQAATAQQQAATAQQQAATAQQQAASGNPLPLGTVVSALPAGCVATPSGGVTYYYCGGNFYQPMYQGSTLVYVTTKPK